MCRYTSLEGNRECTRVSEPYSEGQSINTENTKVLYPTCSRKASYITYGQRRTKVRERGIPVTDLVCALGHEHVVHQVQHGLARLHIRLGDFAGQAALRQNPDRAALVDNLWNMPFSNRN